MSYTTRIVNGKSTPIKVPPAPSPNPVHTQAEALMCMDQDPLTYQYKRVLNFWVPVPILPGEPETWSLERMKLCVQRTVLEEKTSQEAWDQAWDAVNEEIARKHYGVRRQTDADQTGEWKAAAEL